MKGERVAPKNGSQDGAGYHLVQWHDPICLLEVCSVTQFTFWMCAMLWCWAWRLVEDSAYIMSLFLLKGLTKISMGLWEFKLLVLGNKVKVWIWLEPMYYKWGIKFERDIFMLWDTVFGTYWRKIRETSFIYHLSILSSIHLPICPSSIHPSIPFLFSLLVSDSPHSAGTFFPCVWWQ